MFLFGTPRTRALRAAAAGARGYWGHGSGRARAGVARPRRTLWVKKKVLVRVRIPVGENFFLFLRVESFFSARGDNEKVIL